MAHSTTYKRLMADLTQDEPIISESSINAFRRALHNPNNSKLTEEEESEIWDAIWEKHPRITEAQAKKGIDWLLKQWKTPTGAERKNHPFGWREEQVLTSFTHFELIDMQDVSRNSRPFYIPVYRVWGTTAHFDYCAGSWQSGQSLEIIG